MFTLVGGTISSLSKLIEIGALCTIKVQYISPTMQRIYIDSIFKGGSWAHIAKYYCIL